MRLETFLGEVTLITCDMSKTNILRDVLQFV